MPPAAGEASGSDQTRHYVVLYADGASLDAGHTAVAAAGGRVVNENAVVGLAEVVSDNPAFLDDARGQRAVKGAARDRSIGTSRPGMAPKFADERLDDERTTARPHSGSGAVKPAPGADSLTGYQWDMRMIGTQGSDGGPALAARGAGVLVGIIDTGIDGTHPDIAPNFSNALSRNFTVDIPSIDGPCEYADCVDPANVDHDGHGTHVAGTVAAPVNGLGITGVAPESTLVNIRAGQDSGMSEITVAAPGGYFRDFFGTKQFRSALNEIWAPYPETVARATGEVTNGGGPEQRVRAALVHEGRWLRVLPGHPGHLDGHAARLGFRGAAHAAGHHQPGGNRGGDEKVRHG